MTVDQALELGREAVVLTLLLGAPMMLAAVCVGLVVSILQAMTQLQDQTLSFVPKIIAMFVTMLYFLPWTINRMMEYATQLVENIPSSL